jgi:hypothetical protein
LPHHNGSRELRIQVERGLEMPAGFEKVVGTMQVVPLEPLYEIVHGRAVWRSAKPRRIDKLALDARANSGAKT